MSDFAGTPMRKATIKDYYKLAKPGIVYGNVITTIASFLFASRWHFNGLSSLYLFLATIIGLSFIIGSACVCNNYLDRDIDKKMSRTKDRALATGIISVRNALIYGTVLGLIGLALLCVFVNILSGLIALFGFIFYVVVYAYAKRASHWGVVVGSVPGAVPIVVGYTAITNHFDITALILFAVLVMWQMPHFYAIAMSRLDEYKAAGIPVLPVVKGMRIAKVHILLYIIAFIIATVALWTFGFAGYSYLASVLVFGLAWLARGLQGFTTTDDAKWAKKLFLFSLIVLVAFCVTLAVAPLIP
jgi:protoheme IX farnesyltransferase